MRYKKCCGSCAHYFVNVNWEKLCVDETVGEDGKKHVKVKDRLGHMGDTRRACERYAPADYILRNIEREKKERAERRAAKKAAAKAAKGKEGKSNV